MVDYWIQRANFSVKDYHDSEPAEIIDALVTTDWNALIAERKELQAQGQVCGHPGLGIVFSNGEIIHLLEPKSPPYQGVFHYYAQRKILGIFPIESSYSASFLNLSEGNLSKILTSWKPGQHDYIIELLKTKLTQDSD